MIRNVLNPSDLYYGYPAEHFMDLSPDDDTDSCLGSSHTQSGRETGSAVFASNDVFSEPIKVSCSFDQEASSALERWMSYKPLTKDSVPIISMQKNQKKPPVKPTNGFCLNVEPVISEQIVATPEILRNNISDVGKLEAQIAEQNSLLMEHHKKEDTRYKLVEDMSNMLNTISTQTSADLDLLKELLSCSQDVKEMMGEILEHWGEVMQQNTGDHLAQTLTSEKNNSLLTLIKQHNAESFANLQKFFDNRYVRIFRIFFKYFEQFEKQMNGKIDIIMNSMKKLSVYVNQSCVSTDKQLAPGTHALANVTNTPKGIQPQASQKQLDIVASCTNLTYANRGSLSHCEAQRDVSVTNMYDSSAKHGCSDLKEKLVASSTDNSFTKYSCNDSNQDICWPTLKDYLPGIKQEATNLVTTVQEAANSRQTGNSLPTRKITSKLTAVKQTVDRSESNNFASKRGENMMVADTNQKGIPSGNVKSHVNGLKPEPSKSSYSFSRSKGKLPSTKQNPCLSRRAKQCSYMLRSPCEKRKWNGIVYDVTDSSSCEDDELVAVEMGKKRKKSSKVSMEGRKGDVRKSTSTHDKTPVKQEEKENRYR